MASDLPYHQIALLPSNLLGALQSNSGINSLDEIPGLLFQFLADPAYINPPGPGSPDVDSWVSNLGSLSLILISNPGFSFPVYQTGVVNGHDAVTNVAPGTAEMDTSQNDNQFQFEGMTAVMVGTFDCADTSADQGRYLSFCSQQNSLDDWQDGTTWMPAGTDRGDEAGVSVQNNNQTAEVDNGNGWDIPCVILATTDGSTGNMALYEMDIGSTVINSATTPSGTAGMDSDTFSIFANFFEGESGNGDICLCAAWNRVLNTSEITEAMTFLGKTFS